MYFSIPDTTEISAKRSSTQHAYTLFNIHINGIHHCSLRYSQLRTFNDELQRLLPNSMINIQPFPPKKLFNLSLREIDERRLLLERYLQSIVQNKTVISSLYFNSFFLNAQHETILNESIEKNFPEKISLTIQFLNQHEIIIENLSPYDNTMKLLDACTNKIQLDKEYLSYFSLFFYEHKNDELYIIRPLFPFESPYFSLKQTKKINENYCIVFKKSYWDLNYDFKLLDNRRTYKLLFIQSQYDIQQSKDLYPSDIYQQLDNYCNNNSLKEYILLARTSKFYGYIILKECLISDFTTQKLCQCLLAIGNNELVCYLYNDDDEKKKMNLFLKDISFKVTRIRCWKVNWTKEDMNIAFEYLIRKDTLQWITIHTEQAPLVSTCLQGMIDEILAKKMGATSPVPILVLSNNQTNIANGLTTRTRSDLDRFNNNKLFDEGDGDDDL
jgi:sorting nexin-17